MTLAEFSIRRPVFAWMLMVGLILFGLLGLQKLGINENPDIDYPTVRVDIAYEGATPAVIEKDVLEPVESVLVSMEGIRQLTSTADRGNGRITLEFELSKDIDFALQEVQTLLGRAQRELPTAIEPPIVTKSNAADDPIMYLSFIGGKLSKREVMVLFRDQIRDRLSTVEGVAEIRAFGYHEPIMRIDLREEDLRKYQLTANDIFSSIEREHLELPAGRFEYKDSEELIRIMGEADSVEQFKDMTISRRGPGPNFLPIRIKDVANVYEGIENIRRLSRYNGKFALGMAIQKQRGVNAVATAEKVMERLKLINKDLPKGTELKPNFDRTTFIKDNIDKLSSNLILAAILTSLVCWFFLKSFSATFNILLGIPTVVIGTFAFMYIFGFTLNNFTLLGLSLAIGIIVDDSIVMLENIVRFCTEGAHHLKASLLGSKEITFAVIATTLALVAIFAPIILMKGIEGRFFFEFAITLCIAVSLSSFEALTLTPMRCSQFLNVNAKGIFIHRLTDTILKFFFDIYRKGLHWSMKHKIIVIICSIMLFLSSYPLYKRIKQEFAPAQDSGVLFCIFLAPDGKSMEYTNEKVKIFEKIVQNHPDVLRTYVAVGGFGRGGQGNRGNGVIILKDRDKRNQSQFDIARDLREQIKNIQGMRIFIRDRFGSNIGGRRGSPVEFSIKGPDPDKQKELYFQMEKEMEKTNLMVGIRSDDVNELPEIHIVPNREQAAKMGVEVSAIANTINVTTGGVIAGQYTKFGRRFDIFVQLREEDRFQALEIAQLFVRNNRGELIRLSEVVDFVPSSGPQNIYRDNRQRAIRVDANLNKGVVVGQAIKAINKIAEETLPEGYSIEFSQNLEDSLLNIVFIILLGLAVSYMVLSSQFNSFIDPLIVFFAIPFGVTGSLFALFLSDGTLNVYSMIGIMLTMGLVKKNSILIVEFTNQLRDRGMNSFDALIKACTLRFRPIVMTTLSTLAAAIPAAFSTGTGSESRIPLGMVVLGGVSFSAVLTLFLIPCLYLLMERKRSDRQIRIDEILKSQ